MELDQRGEGQESNACVAGVWGNISGGIRMFSSPLLREQCTAQRSGKHQAAKKDATPMKHTERNSLYRRHNVGKISKVFHRRAYQVDYL